MTDDDYGTIREEIRGVGRKVDALAVVAESDRKFLRTLQADYLRLEGRVKLSEERISKAQSDLDKHIEVACVISKTTREDIAETKEMLREHIAQEDVDRKQVIHHLQEANHRVKQEGFATLKWAIGVAVSVVVALFGMLWATGAVQV